MTSSNKKILRKIYRRLFAFYGSQQWWPGDTRFEIIVGAILTQNTNWKNVEKALVNLKQAKVLSPQKFKELPIPKLSKLIQPSGFFNIKAKRLKNFMNFLEEEYQGSLSKMSKEKTDILRRKLLSVNGIGPETADSILLYAFNKPVFVVDAYTKRIFSRHKIIELKEVVSTGELKGTVPERGLSLSSYQAIQDIFERNLKVKVKGDSSLKGAVPLTRMFNEYHALIVRLAKDFCKTKPECEKCPLNENQFYL